MSDTVTITLPTETAKQLLEAVYFANDWEQNFRLERATDAVPLGSFVLEDAELSRMFFDTDTPRLSAERMQSILLALQDGHLRFALQEAVDP